MRQASTDDWLPPGWTVNMKLTSSGRKYKYYTHPSSGLKFYSKPEVSRYLNKSCLNDPGPLEKKSILREIPVNNKAPTGEKKSMEKKKHHRGVAKKVVFERVTPEGLPPGWIKEIKIQKKHGIIRRDPYYTDPVNGYVFRSMKDTLRYLKTGDPGRLAFKPKPRDSGDVKLEDNKTSSPVSPRKQEFPGGGPRRCITRGQSLKLSKIASDDEIPKSVCSGEGLPNTEDAPDQSGAKVTEKNSLYLSEDKDSKNVEEKSDDGKAVLHSASLVDPSKVTEKNSLYQSEDEGSKHVGEKSDNIKNVLESVPLVDPLAEEQPPEKKAKLCEERKTQSGPRKYRNKKSHDLPRRASKRLAGFEADVTPELKTAHRGCRVAAGHSCETEAGTAEPEPVPESSLLPSQKMELLLESNNGSTPLLPSQKMELLLESNNGSTPVADLAPPQKMELLLESNNGSTPVADLAPSQKMELLLESNNGSTPVEDLAPPQKVELLLESNDGSTPAEDLAPPQEQGEKVEAENKGEEKDDYSPSLPLGDGPAPEEHGGVAEHENEAAENPKHLHELPFGDSWTDPCIEFAIKTLISDHLTIDDYFQHQLSSQQAQTDNGDFGLGNLQQTGFPFQTYEVLENPVPEVQLAPHQQDRNVSFPSSSSVMTGGGYQPGEDESKLSLRVLPQTDNGLNLGFGDFQQNDLFFQPFSLAENPAFKPQAPVHPMLQPAGNAAGLLSSGETGQRQSQPGGENDKGKEVQGPKIQQEGNGSFPSSGATRGVHQRGEDKQKGYQKQLIY